MRLHHVSGESTETLKILTCRLWHALLPCRSPCQMSDQMHLHDVLLGSPSRTVAHHICISFEGPAHPVKDRFTIFAMVLQTLYAAA